MPTALVFDYNPEAADTRTERVREALHAVAAKQWGVQTSISRNALLAKLAVLGAGPARNLALIDLYDGESDRSEQTGHRMIATIASNPRLRELCAACACTIYPHPDLLEPLANWGAVALIDAAASPSSSGTGAGSRRRGAAR